MGGKGRIDMKLWEKRKESGGIGKIKMTWKKRKWERRRYRNGRKKQKQSVSSHTL